MNDPKVALALKRFLLIEECPEVWKGLDLYIFRDDAVVFYVGQSQLAFARIWEHLPKMPNFDSGAVSKS